jgi:uroporphyrinogen-III synthase
MQTTSGMALANKTIAITRPTDQAKALTQLVQLESGNVIHFPLIEIAPLEDYSQFNAIINHIHQYDWVIFISSNAVQNGMPFLNSVFSAHTNLPKPRFAAIGPITAQTLYEFGIKDVYIPEGKYDSESLLALPLMQNMIGKKVMIIRGIGGRELLADTLKTRGATVTFAECYHRVNPQSDCLILDNAYQKQGLDALVVTSSEAMRNLLSLCNNAPWLNDVTFCVNHERVAEEAIKKRLTVKVASQSGDVGMMNLLRQLQTNI